MQLRVDKNTELRQKEIAQILSKIQSQGRDENGAAEARTQVQFSGCGEQSLDLWVNIKIE